MNGVRKPPTNQKNISEVHPGTEKLLDHIINAASNDSPVVHTGRCY